MHKALVEYVVLILEVILYDELNIMVWFQGQAIAEVCKKTELTVKLIGVTRKPIRNSRIYNSMHSYDIFDDSIEEK